MTFTISESGAVTVDWVVLTAALVGLGLATMTVVSSGVQDVSTDIDDTLTDTDIIKTSFQDASVAFSVSKDVAFSAFQQPYCGSGTYDDTQSISGQGCILGHVRTQQWFDLEDGSRYKVFTYLNVDGTSLSPASDGGVQGIDQSGDAFIYNNWAPVVASYVDPDGNSATIAISEVPQEIQDAAAQDALLYDLTDKSPGGL